MGRCPSHRPWSCWDPLGQCSLPVSAATPSGTSKPIPPLPPGVFRAFISFQGKCYYRVTSLPPTPPCPWAPGGSTPRDSAPGALWALASAVPAVTCRCPESQPQPSLLRLLGMLRSIQPVQPRRVRSPSPALRMGSL